MKKISKPTDNVPAFYQHYMDLVPDDGRLTSHLEDILIETEKLVTNLSEEKLLYRYAKDKWTIKDIIVHLSDCERIIIYRATCIARGDKTNLPGFDENHYAITANANNRKVNDILNELSAQRAATVAFIETLDEESLNRTGTANGYSLPARLLVNHIYAHHQHHLAIIKEKYLYRIR
jgi:uncharacterized damage-inducible protein DinB